MLATKANGKASDSHRPAIGVRVALRGEGQVCLLAAMTHILRIVRDKWVWYGIVWYGGYGVVWYGMVWYGGYGMVWAKIKPPGSGPQVLVHVSIYQGNPFWVHIFEPHQVEFVA